MDLAVSLARLNVAKQEADEGLTEKRSDRIQGRCRLSHPNMLVDIHKSSAQKKIQRAWEKDEFKHHLRSSLSPRSLISLQSNERTFQH